MPQEWLSLLGSPWSPALLLEFQDRFEDVDKSFRPTDQAVFVLERPEQTAVARRLQFFASVLAPARLGTERIEQFRERPDNIEALGFSIFADGGFQLVEMLLRDADGLIGLLGVVPERRPPGVIEGLETVQSLDQVHDRFLHRSDERFAGSAEKPNDFLKVLLVAGVAQVVFEICIDLHAKVISGRAPRETKKPQTYRALDDSDRTNIDLRVQHIVQQTRERGMAARMLAVASTRTRSSLFLPARSMMSPVSVRKVVTVMVLSGPCAGRRRTVISSLTCPRRVVIVKLGERVGRYARASWPRRRVGTIESSPRSGGAAITLGVAFPHGLECRSELLGVIIASIAFVCLPFEFQRVWTARGRGPIRRASSRASETDDEVVRIEAAFGIRVPVSMQMLLDNLVEEDEAGCERRPVNGRSEFASPAKTHMFARRESACSAESSKDPVR